MHNTIDVIGEDALMDGLIGRTLSGDIRDDTITALRVGALWSCDKIIGVSFPNVATLAVGMNFHTCTSMEYAEVGNIMSVPNQAFANTSALRALVLRVDQVPTLSATGLAGSGLANGVGYVYVPSDLVESFKVATNWSAFAEQFRAIEDYTVDGTLSGEIDRSKV